MSEIRLEIQKDPTAVDGEQRRYSSGLGPFFPPLNLQRPLNVLTLHFVTTPSGPLTPPQTASANEKPPFVCRKFLLALPRYQKLPKVKQSLRGTNEENVRKLSNQSKPAMAPTFPSPARLAPDRLTR